MYSVDKITSIYLGHQGEHGARKIEIDISSMLALLETENPENTVPDVSMLVMRKGDPEPYLAPAILEGNTLTWRITDVETAKPGQGQVEIRLTTESSLIKSGLIATYVDPAMIAPSEETPAPYQEWVARVLETAAGVEQHAYDARTAAEEAKAAVAEVDLIDDSKESDTKTWSSERIGREVKSLSDATIVPEFAAMDITSEVEVFIGEYLAIAGNTVAYANAPADASHTDYLAVSPGDVFYLSGCGMSSTTIVAFYDADKKFLRSAGNKEDSGGTVYWEEHLVEIEADTAFVRFGSYPYTQYPLVVKKGVHPTFSRAYDGTCLLPRVEAADHSVYAAQARDAVYAEIAAGIGVRKLEMQKGYVSVIGYENVCVDSQHTIVFSFRNTTAQANDAGASFIMGTRGELQGRKILIRHDDPFRFEQIAFGFKQGSGWGKPLFNLKQYVSDYNSSTWIFDFDTAMNAALAGLSDELDDSFDGIVYLMLYGNQSWNLTTLSDDELACNYYAVLVDSSDPVIYSETIDNLNKSVRDMEKTVEGLDSGHSDNILWEKKYVACGDSFTEGDFSSYTDASGLTGKDSDAYDSEWGCYKTYPYWIARRNNMTLINEAKCGSIMSLSKQYITYRDNPKDNEAVLESSRNPFALKRYMAIPEDADYITLWFGINDASNTNLGTIDDTTNETFYGAWNVVLEWFLTNRPYAKIGIIITTGSSADYRTAVRDVALKWGIPYLDMMGNPQVPVIFGRETEQGLCSKANILRQNAFVVSASNGHPSLKAHEYESTFIEHFLRSL